MKKITIFTLIGLALFLSGCTISDVFNKNASQPRTNENVNNVIINDSVTDTMTEAEARVTAEKTCIKGGESLSPGYYNEGTKTWWFDANLNATKEGCNPACVVSEETKTAEINWRCTGLIVPVDISEDIKSLFTLKYPEYRGSITIRIDQQTSDHIRGGVTFVDDQAGGIFLATKIDGVWQLVFDGNGAIPCSLNKYGFPSEMLVDCAQ